MSPLTPADTQRFTFEGELTRTEIELLVKNPSVKVIQCEVKHSVKPATWDLLNERFFAQRPDVELRLWGGACDLAFLHRLRNVKRFSADCLRQVEGIEHLKALVNLEVLSIGVYHLESFDFLEVLPAGIKDLSLALTKSKKPRLDALSRFGSLQKLYLEGQENGIQVLSKLPSLEEVTLRSIGTENVEYIASLPKLWRLDIKLGGIRDFSSIENKQSIKYLELWQVRGLSDLSFVSSLTGIQYLFLQSLRNVIAIPDLSKLTMLRRLYLENMKGLKDVSAIAQAPALEEFTHASAQNIEPEKYEGLLSSPTMRSVRVGFGSQKKNDAFADLSKRNGKSSDSTGKLGKQFVFV